MKIINWLTKLSLFVITAAVLNGCALGAGTDATAGYAIKSQSADSLTASAEKRVVDRAKAEIMAEISMQNQSKTKTVSE